MEFKIQTIKRPEPIAWNYDELKAELIEKVSFYENLVYTEDQIKEAKSDRASLNKLRKALNDERIRLQKEYMAPFDVFKKQVDDLIATIDRPAAVIDKQVKAYEERCKELKDREIRSILETVKLPCGISPETIRSPKWLNATVTTSKIHEEIQAAKERIEADAQTLEGLTEYKDQALREAFPEDTAGMYVQEEIPEAQGGRLDESAVVIEEPKDAPKAEEPKEAPKAGAPQDVAGALFD